MFLCAASSIDAQDWAMEAVECERIVFQAEDPMEVNEALIRKSLCYRNMDRYSEAAATLGRVKMYLLGPEEQEQVLLQKARCHAMAGDCEEALSDLGQICSSGSELGIMLHQQIEELKRRVPAKKSGDKAMLRAMLPPFGHLYSGRADEGLLSMGLNAAAAGWTLWQCLSGCWVSGLLGGGIALNYTYMGNLERSVELAEEFNEAVDSELASMLLAVICAHIPAE